MTGRLVRFLIFGVIPLLVILLVLLGFSSYWTYSRFNTEVPVAELKFSRFGEDVYIAELRSGDFCFPEEFPLYGDQWQLDAAFLKWKGPGVMLGLESVYRLDRLSGRYADIREQNSRQRLSHDLRPEAWFDLFESRLLQYGDWLLDTQYGSSVFMNIDIRQRYIVYKTEDALIVKQQPLQDGRQDGNMLTIEISRACGNQPDRLSQATALINRLALRYLSW